MTSLPAFRRDLARQTTCEDEALPDAELPLPGLPTPGPVARDILALFDAGPDMIVIPPGLRLH